MSANSNKSLVFPPNDSLSMKLLDNVQEFIRECEPGSKRENKMESMQQIIFVGPCVSVFVCFISLI